jgi:pimeloyl-ACP methyl ester carboxylesterase
MQLISKLAYLYEITKFFSIKICVSFVKIQLLQDYFLPYQHSIIHYSVFGTGKKILFCFHGYGENGNSFELLKPLLEKDFTMVCIDLPFHGKTEWNEGLLFIPNQLIEIMSLIKELNHQAINLLGYSMGGKASLQLLQLIPAQIERVVLIAPDGLHNNFWHWFSTQTFIGNKLFKFSIHHPSGIFFLMKLADKLRLINKSILKIAHYYMDDKNERELLYKRWITMRKFKPVLSSVKSNIKKHKIPVQFLFGKYDSIILSKRSNFLKSDVENIQVHEIGAGHQLLKGKYAQEIAKLFYQ